MDRSGDVIAVGVRRAKFGLTITATNKDERQQKYRDQLFSADDFISSDSIFPRSIFAFCALPRFAP